MRAMLDGLIEFEQSELSVDSWQRDEMERAAAGVDGAVSIDLGNRTRQIVQKGVMRTASRSALMAKIDFAGAMANGTSHSMEKPDGEIFDDLRIDSFKAGMIDYSGSGASCEVEFKYTQLRDS